MDMLIGVVMIVGNIALWVYAVREMRAIRRIQIPAIKRAAQTQVTISADGSHAEATIDRLAEKVRVLTAQLELTARLEGLREHPWVVGDEAPPHTEPIATCPECENTAPRVTTVPRATEDMISRTAEILQQVADADPKRDDDLQERV